MPWDQGGAPVAGKPVTESGHPRAWAALEAHDADDEAEHILTAAF